MKGIYEVMPVSAIRKVIAARTAEATRTIPHFRVHEEIETDALEARRNAFRRVHPEESISLNDVLVRACADELIAVPGLNIQWVDGEIRQFQSADIAVIVALKDGLATPIVRHAEQKPVPEIGRAIRALTDRARSNALKTEEVFGGTFSVSNLGAYGALEFDAIINPPQCAILAVGSARPSVLAGVDGKARIATVIRVTLSCDHRAVDGAAGASFLARLKQRLEDAEQLERMLGTL